MGGAFALLEATGALGRLVGALARRTRRPRLVVVGVSLAFATFGALADRAGQHAVAVNDQWRICFRFADGDAYEVEFCDYH